LHFGESEGMREKKPFASASSVCYGKCGKAWDHESSPGEDLVLSVPSWRHVVYFAHPHAFPERTRKGQKVHDCLERSKSFSELSGRRREKQGGVGTFGSIANIAARSADASCFCRNSRKALARVHHLRFLQGSAGKSRNKLAMPGTEQCRVDGCPLYTY
jgi:hypothetical protein